jgi:hypothetical protein
MPKKKDKRKNNDLQRHYHMHLFHSKNICPWSKEEEGAYIFWMKQVPVDTTQKNQWSSNMNTTKNQGWTQVLRKCS